MTTAPPPSTDRDGDAADRAMQQVQAKRPNAAARILMTELERRMTRYFLRHRVPESEAESLTNELFFRFVCSEQYDGRSRPVVWLWALAHNLLIDWWRKENAAKRGRTENTVSLDDDDLPVDTLIQQATEPLSDEAPPWLRLCVQRAARQLEQDDPNRAQVLWFKYQAMSAAEIALIYGAKPPPSADEERNARDRVYNAVKKAKDYFSHCRDQS